MYVSLHCVDFNKTNIFPIFSYFVTHTKNMTKEGNISYLVWSQHAVITYHQHKIIFYISLKHQLSIKSLFFLNTSLLMSKKNYPEKTFKGSIIFEDLAKLTLMLCAIC